jgi:hypothetical protein
VSNLFSPVSAKGASARFVCQVIFAALSRPREVLADYLLTKLAVSPSYVFVLFLRGMYDRP